MMYSVHSVQKDQKLREEMNKWKQVTQRLATGLNKYQLVVEEEDLNDIDHVEEDLEWNCGFCSNRILHYFPMLVCVLVTGVTSQVFSII